MELSLYLLVHLYLGLLSLSLRQHAEPAIRTSVRLCKPPRADQVGNSPLGSIDPKLQGLGWLAGLCLLGILRYTEGFRLVFTSSRLTFVDQETKR